MRPADLPNDPDQLWMAVRHPTDGRAIRYHADEFLVRWIATLFDAVAREPLVESAARHYDGELLRMYVEEALYLELLSVGRDYMRRSYLRLMGHPSRKPVTCPAAIFELARQHWPDNSIGLVPRTPVVEAVHKMARLRHRFREALSRIARAPQLALPLQPTIAVELVEGSDPGAKSDVFWLANGAIDPRRVLFLVEPQNRTFINFETELASIRRLGARAIALDASVSAGGRIPLWLPPRSPRILRTHQASLRRAQTPFGRWLRRLLVTLAKRTWYWESLFRQFNVAIYQQFTELTLDTAARRMAIDRVGGIEIGKMRSQFFDRSSPAFHFQHEIALVWNANVRPLLEHGRTRTRELVEVGYVWDHLLSSSAAEARALRARLERAGVNRVITLYDNHPHLNSHSARDQIERVYRHLVDLVQRHDGLGLIVKSKKPLVLRLIPEAGVALKALEQGGRCVVLDEPLTSIAPSALAADLVVAVPASTAGCEAALGGRRVLMYDPGGCKDHPLCGKDRGVIFPDFEDFQRALGRWLNGAAHSACGDAGPWLSDIDPFRDGHACSRAAAYIGGFLEARDAGSSKADALRRAREKYQASLQAHDGA